jgi:hypothetical protein
MVDYNTMKKKPPSSNIRIIFIIQNASEASLFYLVQQSLVSVCEHFRHQHPHENYHMLFGMCEIINAMEN